MTQDYDAWIRDFSCVTADINGIKTALYQDPNSDPLKPACLFVHGLTGDHHGLVPIAFELRHECRAVFVDLPGHGRTETPPDIDFLAIRDWSRKLLDTLRQHGVEVTTAVGHSFGSYVVQESAADCMVLLNPPFALSSLSRKSSKLLGKVPSTLGKLYNCYPLMVQRGRWLVHSRTKESDEIVSWSSQLSKITKEQFRFQARLAEASLKHDLMDVAKLACVPKLIFVVSEYDKVVDNSLVAVESLPRALCIKLPTDHVSVFELPHEVADVVRRFL